MKHIYFTVTNDLSYDQRMHRICTSLSQNGFRVTLVGRKLSTSIALEQRPFKQKRLRCIFNKSALFYAEYNLRLFFYLKTKKMDAICAIDLDTILPCLAISKIKKINRIYDAHEYFTELKEVRTRPLVKKLWQSIERYAIPKYTLGYTVSEGLAQAFKKAFNRDYLVVRNLPKLMPSMPALQREEYILYQGAVNEARGFEYLIPAMRNIDYPLIICGDGNFMQKLRDLIANNDVTDKVQLKGMLRPQELRGIAQKASLGIGLAEKEGINQFHALPNKFLEYMHAGLPQVTMNFPEYRKINDRYRVAVLLDDLSVDGVSACINETMKNRDLLQQMNKASMVAREIYNWQAEEKGLLQFYQKLFS